MLGDAGRRDQVRDERGRIFAADRIVPPRHGIDVGEQVVFAVVVAALHRELADALDGVGQDRVIVDADQKGLARRTRRAGREQAVALELAVDALIRERRHQLRLGDDWNLLDVVIGLQVRGFEAGLLVLGAIDRDFPVGHLDQFLDARELLGADFLDRQIRMRHALVEIAVGDVDQVGILLATLFEFRASVLGFPELKPVRRSRRRVGGNFAVVELRGFGRDLSYAIHCRLHGFYRLLRLIGRRDIPWCRRLGGAFEAPRRPCDSNHTGLARRLIVQKQFRNLRSMAAIDAVIREF